MDVENVNCKIRVSQCVDMEIIPIERPLKVTQEINGLDRLVQELHRVFSLDFVNIQAVQKLMAGYKSNPKDWSKYAKFDRYRYTRNLVDSGNGAFNIMILCWGPGHASAIHDHADSHCFMKLLRGSLDEVRYDWPRKVQPEVRKVLQQREGTQNDIESKMADMHLACQNDSCQNYGGHVDRCQEDYEHGDCDSEQMEEIGRTRLEVDDVCYINDALGLHRMENTSDIDPAVSLHLYSPPFDSCRVFDERTGKPAQVKVTFWSVGGKKIKRVIEADAADSQQ